MSTGGSGGPGYPILEHDPDRSALIEPGRDRKPTARMPEHCVLCFFGDVVRAYVKETGAEIIDRFKSEMGRIPIYRAEWQGRPFALAQPGVGAPLSAGVMELAIALGGRRFVSCGGAGALVPDLPVGHLIAPEAAVRDEGTSYHYMAPSRTVGCSEDVHAAVVATLEAEGLAFSTGLTWTTDAYYRETRARVRRRRDEGCVAVEMECAALFAVGRFRGVEIASLLYAGDDMSGEQWRHRGWDRAGAIRRRVLELAVQGCLGPEPAEV